MEKHRSEVWGRFPTCRRFRRLAIGPTILFLGIAFWATPACAMHISEGILPINWAGLWFLVAAPFVFWGLRVIDRRRRENPQALTLVAMVGAAVFVISCMPIPVLFVGTCSHPCGTGLGALLIGPGPTVVVASIALLFQALFLCHGGLTTLGANIVSMGVVGAFSAYGTFHFLRRMRVPIFAAALAAGVLSDWATYATTSFELSSALYGDGSFWGLFVAVMIAFVPTQLPLGIVEGVVTAYAHRFVLQRRPDLLGARAPTPCPSPRAPCTHGRGRGEAVRDDFQPDLLEVGGCPQHIPGADA